MDSSEKLCLQWNDFKENVAVSFNELREDREFTDVTLVCEDGQQIEAHKVVLVLSSPFFMELLRKNKHPHPLIYMRGLRSGDLVAIMDFLYHGEANILQDDLYTFLALAEELKLKGLTGGAKTEKEPHRPLPSNNAPQKQEIGQQFLTSLPKSNFENPPLKVPYDTAVDLKQDKISVNLEDLDEQIKTMFTKSTARTNNGQGSLATCNICGNQGPLKTMPRHIEANHITGVSHSCDICGKVSRSRNSLSKHVSRRH